MKLTKYSQLRHGMKVTCKINGKKITDAKLSMDKNGSYYVCQNESFGIRAEDMLGYGKSWLLAYKGEDAELWHPSVTDLESVEEEEGKFYVGQKVWYDGDSWMPEGVYTVAELNDDGDPRIKKGSDKGYSTSKHLLLGQRCRPIKEKPKNKHDEWTPHYTCGGTKLEENCITIDGKKYTPEELKKICYRYRAALAAHDKYFPPAK